MRFKNLFLRDPLNLTIIERLKYFHNKHKVQELEKKPRVHTLSRPSPLQEEILSPRTLNPTTWKNKRYSPPHNLSNELSKDCHEDKYKHNLYTPAMIVQLLFAPF